MRILLVCLGNICRSPLAHGSLEHLAKQAGLDWSIDSAGTGNWHIGHAPDSRAIAVARKNRIDITRQRARQITTDDFESYDLILAMDKQNYQDILKLTKSEAHQQKVKLFLEEEDIQDPYFDDKLFDSVFDKIYNRSKALIKEYSDDPRK